MGTTLEQDSSALQKSMDAIVNRFQQACLTPQKKNLECALSCFPQTPPTPNSGSHMIEDSITTTSITSPFQSVQKCMSTCQQPFEKLQSIAQKDLQSVQATLSGCQQNCQTQLMPRIEALRSGMLAGAALSSAATKQLATDVEQKTIQLEMEKCTQKCIATAREGLPALEERLGKYVDNS